MLRVDPGVASLVKALLKQLYLLLYYIAALLLGLEELVSLAQVLLVHPYRRDVLWDSKYYLELHLVALLLGVLYLDINIRVQ